MRLIAVFIRAPGPHSVHPAPITSASATTSVAAAAAAAAAAAKEKADATAAVMAASTTVTPAAVIATSTTVAASTSAAAAAMAAAAAVADKLYHRGCSVAFFVEYVEGSQADIRDFFLTQSDLIAISVAWGG
jgi:hypothetical protein